LNKVLVICQGRVGSTYFCNQLSVQYDLENLWELFNINSKFSQGLDKTDDLFRKLETRNRWVAKALTDHVWSQAAGDIPEFIRIYTALHQQADQVYYLYRPRFSDHVKSVCASIQTNQYFNHRKPRHISASAQEIAKISAKVRQRWKLLRTLYEILPGEPVSMDSLPIQGKYPDVYTFSEEFDDIPDFDVAAYLFGGTSKTYF